MGQSKDELTENLAERLCWEVARRDDSRITRRLFRNQVVEGVSRPDEGALLDDSFHFLRAIGVMALLEDVHGTTIQRERLPYVQYVLLYGLKTVFGSEGMNALPALLCSGEALMQTVGFTAPSRSATACASGGPPSGRASAPEARFVRIPWRRIP
ncbi:MAG: hypothetical protein HYZ81_27155 [Nitrospinae bacterium]|nr:hypothetical protein [Nitrospinota bacterium]